MTIRIKSRQQNFPDNDYFIRHYYEFFNFNYRAQTYNDGLYLSHL